LLFFKEFRKGYVMLTKLFIGNIPYTWNDQKMNDLFAQAGSVVSAKVICDKYSGRSRGFGFVEMASPDEAQKAVDMYNGKEIDGRQLIVNEARPPRENNPGEGPTAV
jgi:RNA recognition motif-containing protein